MARLREEHGTHTELAEKLAELSALRVRHAQCRCDLHQLRSDIAVFAEGYHDLLGRRVAELDAIESELSRLRPPTSSASSPDDPSDEPPLPEPKWQAPTADIKSLYREVAKNIHPDLGSVRCGTLNRNELMQKANRAYAEEDRRTLQEILQKWWLAREYWDAEWADLLETRRLIAREQKAITALEAEVEEVRSSLAYRLKHRIDGGAVGSDLLADMVTAVDLAIARARQRLARARKEQADGQPHSAGVQQDSSRGRAGEDAEPGSRTVQFPEELSEGVVYLRDRNSSNFSQWKRVGMASGAYLVGPEKALRLDLRAPTADLNKLRRLNPNDLQALYLYDATDADLQAILHLGGLEELYLTGAKLTDAGLGAVSALKGLKRIYIYQTAVSDVGLTSLRDLPLLSGLTSSGNRITEEGLTGFRRVMPGVQTVSFEWKR